MLSTAVLGTLAPVDAGSRGLYANAVDLPGNQVDLAVQPGHKERMNHIVRGKVDIDCLTNRNVDFVGGHEVGVERALQIVGLPPPLVAGHPDIGRCMGMAMKGKRGHEAEPK